MGKRHKWTENEIKYLEEEYSKRTPIDIISKNMGLSHHQILSKASRMGFGSKYIKTNSPNYKAIYQDYDWCYERYVNRGMTHEEMAKEAGCSKRVIEKWCSQIFHLNNRTFRSVKHITDLQKQIIMFGTLGDGHIDRREAEPMYIETHSEDEKDYLYWKYTILSDICNQPPVFYPESYNDFGAGKQYLCKPFYRLNTKVLDDLYEIRAMKRTDIINQLNELGFCLHILDDGSRGNLWEVCLAEWTQEEKDLYQKICMSRFGLTCKQNKDDRYYTFNAVSSKKIDQMILDNFPNDLDIIHKKILDNNKIKKLCHYRYVLLEDGKIGLGNYCRRINRFGQYEMIRDVFDSIGTEEVEESVLLEAISHII